MLGVTTRAVNHWHRAWRQEGTAALVSKGLTGPDCLLTDHQQHELRQILRRGAKDYGFSTDGWTLARIRRVIIETFGVAYADLSRGVAAAAPDGLDQPAARPPGHGTR